MIEEIRKTTDKDEKKALLVKLFYEYIQSCEHLIVLVHAVKKNSSLKGFRKAIVKCPSGGKAFKYLWTDLRKFQRNPYRFYVYLGIPLEKGEYDKDKNAKDGLFKAVIGCLKNKYSYSRQNGVSKVSRAFAKIKHGFPLYNDFESDDIFIYLSKNNQIKGQLLVYKDEVAEDIYKSLESTRNSMMNLCGLIADKGIKRGKSDGIDLPVAP